MVGSFLVSVFSSLLFLCFFFDKGGLIVFITTEWRGVGDVMEIGQTLRMERV